MKIDAVVNLCNRKQKKKSEEQKKTKEKSKSSIEKNMEITMKLISRILRSEWCFAEKITR